LAADLTFDPGNGNVTVSWQANIINSTMEPDPTVDALIQAYANDPDYLALVNTRSVTHRWISHARVAR